jgi:pantetheine-phosphate adenylyltransferase
MTLIYPGSFDPVTTGHIDIAHRAAKFAERIIVAVLENPNKQTVFSAAERLSFLNEALTGCGNIEIEMFSGLLAEFAKRKNADAILRGLRTSEDFENENKYAACNSALSEAFGAQIETVFLPASPALTHVSSSIIREAAVHIYKNNLDDSFIAGLVPALARAALREKFSEKMR